jgi:hypothetical protein
MKLRETSADAVLAADSYNRKRLDGGHGVVILDIDNDRHEESPQMLMT